MSIQAISTKVISTLGNKDSLIPVMIKDGVDSTSLTYNSYKAGGLVEGIDRGIDEFGTQAIWIGGIPFYKKLIDLTAYKLKKINHNVDPRVIANKEYASWAKENAQGIIDKSGQTVKDAISDCLKDGGQLAKKLYKGKIIAATALTLITYFLLTKSKQKNTKKNVISELKAQNNAENKNKNSKDTFYNSYNQILKAEQGKSIFSGFDKFTKNTTPSFSGLMQNLSDAIMFNPVHNMKIIDAGITTERLACSRNKTEFCEHAIKEGAFLFFIYGFGNLLEKGINKLSDKVFKKPIDLKIDVLMDGKFKEALSSGKIAADAAKLPSSNAGLTDKLNFIINNPDNIVVQAAKKSNIIQTVKNKAGKNVVDTSKFIDLEAFENLAKDLLNINEKFSKSNEPINKFLNKTKGLKVGSTLANIGISCFILGYLIPKAVYKYREYKTGSTKFHVAEDIKNNAEKKKDIQ